MAKPQVILLLDSGALIAAGKNRKVEAIIRRWRDEDARFLIAAPAIAESVRGSPRDAALNKLIKIIGWVEPTTETIARAAGAILAKAKSDKTIDALIVATAQHVHATDILTSDSRDMQRFAAQQINIHAL